MTPSKEKKPMLNSWKEIAQYLDVDVRTCQRWEIKYQMPVQRFDKSKKSRIFIYQNELDAWLKNKLVKNCIKNAEKKSFRKYTIIKKWLPALLLILVIISVSFVFKMNGRNNIPVDFKIQRSVLIIINDSGEELWRYNTKCEGLIKEEKYKKLFQIKRLNNKNIPCLPMIAIRDINGDHLPEVLFAHRTSNFTLSNKLLIFNHKGKIITKILTGKESQYGGVTFSGDFYIDGFDTHDLDGDGFHEILIVSNQIPFFPTQFLLMDSNGNKKGEYWNSGRISDVIASDLNQDSIKEILISGMNNEYKKGFLAVFDSRHISGSSPQESSKYTSTTFKKGSELYYMLFPRTDLDLLDQLLDNCIEIRILENKYISARTKHTNNIFLFDLNLNLKNIMFSSIFEFSHKKAVLEQRITSILNNDYKNSLKINLLYFNGKSWLNKTSKSNNFSFYKKNI